LDRVWYVHSAGQTYGPYVKDEVIKFLLEGSLQFTDYIFREGFKDWEFVYNVPEFDRRIIMPGGNQPKVEQPKEHVPVVSAAPMQKVEEAAAQEYWYIHDGESQLGPYTKDYISKGIDNKTIFWTYFVWKEGFDNWIQLKECKEFDRRKMPRGASPVNVGVTTNINEIQQTAQVNVVKTSAASGSGSLYVQATQPAVTSNQQQYSNKNQSTSISIDSSMLGKKRTSVKATILFIFVFAILFAGIYFYPMILEQIKEYEALKMYKTAVTLIDSDKKEEGFDYMYAISDTFPGSKSEQKAKNYLIAKQPQIKSFFVDETKRIKKLMDSFVDTYGVLPANAVDINYVPPFWISYFGEVYYKRTEQKVSVMTYGIKEPMEKYLYSIDEKSLETEKELSKNEFESLRQSYIKLIYKGPKSSVSPIIKAQPALQAPLIVAPKVAQPAAAKAVKAKPAPSKPKLEKKEKPEPEPVEEVAEPEEKEEVAEESAEEPEQQEEVPAPKQQGKDEYLDLINKIKKDK